jgi:hypothetical protein
MSGATRCDEVLRLIDEALADHERAAARKGAERARKRHAWPSSSAS